MACQVKIVQTFREAYEDVLYDVFGCRLVIEQSHRQNKQMLAILPIDLRHGLDTAPSPSAPPYQQSVFHGPHNPVWKRRLSPI